jgi:hypothetical protein
MTTLATKDGLITQSASVPGLVAAIYKAAVGQSINHATYTIVNFDTKELDTHSAVTVGADWRFTAPMDGLYVVSTGIMFAATALWEDGETGSLSLFKNDSFAVLLDHKDNYGVSVAVHMQLSGSTAMWLAAGEYIDIRVWQSSGTALSIHSNELLNRVAIHRASG